MKKFKFAIFVVFFSLLLNIQGMQLTPSMFNLKQADASSLEVWWPTEEARISGEQPFKGMLSGRSVNNYKMYWSVDGGGLSPMETNWEDYPHKETKVDVSNWNWRGEGPYEVKFTATDKNDKKLTERTVNVFVEGSSEEPSSFLPVSSGSSEEENSQDKHVNVESPQDGAWLSGATSFRAVLGDASLDSYSMYWRVGGGQLNEMYDVHTDNPHKEANINLSGWNWLGEGPYDITFVAKDTSGNHLAESSVNIYVGNAQEATQPVSEVESPQSDDSYLQDPAPTYSSGNPFAGAKFYVDPNSPAKQFADMWRSSKPYEASMLDKIASQPGAKWFGDWNSNIYQDVKNATDVISASGSLPVFIAYNIPQRDCGSYSAGGAGSPDSYRSWISDFANAIGDRKAAVILEPDALPGMDCLSYSDQQTRLSLLKDAVNIFNSKGNIAVYIDAGNPFWKSAEEISSRLEQAGVQQARGFALNVSNYFFTGDNVNYGNRISSILGGKPFVVDTSRNGAGPSPDYQWCNPYGRAIGERSTANTGSSAVDAFFWLKVPGESDGTCNGGPSAGVFWPEYAVGLAERANW